jgi:transposase-like protein
VSRRVPRLSDAELVDRYIGQGQTQARIATEVGVDHSTVGAWLRGAGIPTRRRGARPVVSAERWQHVIAAYTEGASLHALAGEYHLSHTTVWRYLLAAGVTVRPAGGSSPRLSAGRRAQVLAAYTQGASISTVAAQHGISRATVRADLRDAGVPPRLGSGTRPGGELRMAADELITVEIVYRPATQDTGEAPYLPAEPKGAA